MEKANLVMRHVKEKQRIAFGKEDLMFHCKVRDIYPVNIRYHEVPCTSFRTRKYYGLKDRSDLQHL